MVTQIKIKSFNFPHNKFEKKCFYLNYDVTKLHHMSLIEFNFNQDESDKRADIFCLKNVLSDTHFYDFVKKNTFGEKINNQRFIK